MKTIIRKLYTEPVYFALTLNGVITAVAAAGKISGWIAVATLAFTAPLLRSKVTPAGE